MSFGPYTGPPEPKVIALTKCKFCGGSLTHGCYPKYTGSSTVNHWCNSCRAHYYGERPGPYKWYTKKEWFDYVNG